MEKIAFVSTWVMCLGWKEKVHPSFNMFNEDENELESFGFFFKSPTKTTIICDTAEMKEARPQRKEKPGSCKGAGGFRWGLRRSGAGSGREPGLQFLNGPFNYRNEYCSPSFDGFQLAASIKAATTGIKLVIYQREFDSLRSTNRTKMKYSIQSVTYILCCGLCRITHPLIIFWFCSSKHLLVWMAWLVIV